MATDYSYTVLLAGRTGAGKSTLARNILGEGFHEISASQTARVLRNTTYGRTIQVIDTIGLEDEKHTPKNKKVVKHLHSHKVDRFLYCLPVAPMDEFQRFNPCIMLFLQDELGKEIWENCTIILTFSNLAWNRYLKNHKGDTYKATAEYKAHLRQYTDSFNEQLRTMKVLKKVTLKAD